MNGSLNAVVDPYDDDFSSLKRLFADRTMPDFIKTASIMSTDGLSRLPDHAFAVVMLDGDRCMRKYACVDKAHTAVNVMYFLESNDDFPEPAKVKAAANLKAACKHFDLSVPALLDKLASPRKRLIKTDAADMVVPVGHRKESELSGSPIMPITARPSRAKLASVMEDPYVMVRGAPVKIERTTYDPAVCALDDGRLPLEDFHQVKEAMSFFEQHGRELHPRVRHSMCIKIASRADQLCVPVPDVIRKYGSQTYASPGMMEAAVETRRRVWADLSDDQTGPGMLSMLMEKKASMSPEDFAETLSELDVVTGIDRYWDGGVMDPWLTTFGVAKKASDGDWRWSQGTEYLTAPQLLKFVKESPELLEKKFGEAMAKGLEGNPISVFDSLPLDTKRVIARMAQQHESGL
jgi:hypothetical protein